MVKRIIRFIILLVGCIIFTSGGCFDYTLNLGGSYNFAQVNSLERVIGKSETKGVSSILIPPDVILVVYNNDFIIVKQQVFDEQKLTHLEKFNYWIILKRVNVELGPFTCDEFIKMCNVHNIPNKVYNHIYDVQSYKENKIVDLIDE